MTSMSKQQPIDELVAWVVGNLPDSLRERRRVLDACIVCLPLGSKRRQGVAELILHMDAHERAQAELPGLFENFKDGR